MFRNGAPEEIRTPNPQIRSLVLYPVELRAPGLGWFWTDPGVKVADTNRSRFFSQAISATIFVPIIHTGVREISQSSGARSLLA